VTGQPLLKCGRCRQPVLPARTERGRRIALDPQPDPKGNQAAFQDSDGTWKTRQFGQPGSDPPWGWETVYTPHVATCSPAPAPVVPADALPKNVTPITAARSVRSGTRRR
jgi:hypothetical protein